MYLALLARKNHPHNERSALRNLAFLYLRKKLNYFNVANCALSVHLAHCSVVGFENTLCRSRNRSQVVSVIKTNMYM